MDRESKAKGKRKEPSSKHRTTVSFPPESYETLEGIAKQKKVSVGWVIREAVDQYIAEKWPLFGHRKGE
jgi:predicted DNA-binding protein